MKSLTDLNTYSGTTQTFTDLDSSVINYTGTLENVDNKYDVGVYTTIPTPIEITSITNADIALLRIRLDLRTLTGEYDITFPTVPSHMEIATVEPDVYEFVNIKDATDWATFKSTQIRINSLVTSCTYRSLPITFTYYGAYSDPESFSYNIEARTDVCVPGEADLNVVTAMPLALGGIRQRAEFIMDATSSLTCEAIKFSGFSVVVEIPAQTMEAITLPITTVAGDSYTVYWGDGAEGTYTTDEPGHYYNNTSSTPAQYSIVLTGKIDSFGASPNDAYFRGRVKKFANGGRAVDLQLRSIAGAFRSTALDFIGPNYNNSIQDWSNTFQSVTIPAGAGNYMKDWDMSGATKMRGMFAGADFSNLTGTIALENWDISNVTDVLSMFASCDLNYQNMANWNTSGITNMALMFNRATRIGAVTNWDTSNVTTMEVMFLEASGIPNMSNWDTSSVTSMRSMFEGAGGAGSGIGNWNTSSVTDMSKMFFRNTSFNQNIGSWNVSNVTDMSYMFSTEVEYNEPKFIGSPEMQVSNNFNNGGSPSINNWNTSSVTNMDHMFCGCEDFNQPIGSWTTTNVTNMSHMFINCNSFNQNIGSWNVSNVTDMDSMFARTYPPGYKDANDVASFNNGGSSSIDNWRPSSCTTMRHMFRNQHKFNQPIGNWTVGNVTTMRQMFAINDFIFYGYPVDEPKAEFNQNLNNWNVSNVTDMLGMFQWCIDFNQPLNNWDISNVTSIRQMFGAAWSFNQNIGGWNTSNVVEFFDVCKYATDFANDGGDMSWDLSNALNGYNTNSMFEYTHRSPSQSIGDMSQMNTTGIKAMDRWFKDARYFNGYVSGWNTLSVISLDETFKGAANFNNSGQTGSGQVGPSLGWVTGQLTSIDDLFYGCTDLNCQVSTLNVSQVSDFSNVFRDCYWFNQPLNSWNVSNGSSMQAMFRGATSFNQPLNAWNTSSVTDMTYMFYQASVYNQDISSWCVSQIPSKPTGFDTSTSTSWTTAEKPQWGDPC